METESAPDVHELDTIDFEREFGAFDVASLFPPFEFIHDYFIGFFNIISSGFRGSPPIAFTFVPTETKEHVVFATRNHIRKNAISSFYYLTSKAYQLVCQIVFQVSYAIINDDIALLPVLQHQIAFIYLLYCIYYGVEHYMMTVPKRVEQVPATALRLGFTKGLNKVGQVLATRKQPLQPFHPEIFTMPSGGNLLEIKYYTEDPIDSHMGTPFDKNKKYTLQVEITVHTFEMLPVVKKEHIASYINDRLKGNENIVERLVIPNRVEDSRDYRWLKTEPVPAFPHTEGKAASSPMST
jgi:hypothetical protein